MQISNSSWISDIRSNGSLSKHIDLTTKTGKTYTYEVAGDPIDFIQNVKDAESVGVFVNKCFKDETLTRVDVWLRNKGGIIEPDASATLATSLSFSNFSKCTTKI